MDITSLVIFTVSLYVAYKVGQWSILGELASKLKEAGVDLDPAVEATDEQKIKIEKHHETYYAFGSNDQFLAQGSTFNDLFTSIKTRFPGEDFRVDKHPEGLSHEEAGKLVESIFEVFGKRETK